MNATFFVTGATSGIGEATAVRLASAGHRVILGARNSRRGAAALERLRTRVPDAAAEVLVADLAELAQVRSLAVRLRERTGRLDGLVLNAGVAQTSRELNSDGIERMFATNYLSQVYLARLLIPLLASTAFEAASAFEAAPAFEAASAPIAATPSPTPVTPSRIVVVSSSNHARVKHLDLDRIASGSGADYPETKLLGVLFVRELARRLRDSPLAAAVTVNAADPGFVRTDLGREATGVFGVYLAISRPIQDSPHKAAATSEWLATAPEIAGVSGGYFTNRRPAKTSELARDPRLAAAVWDVSTRLLAEKGFPVE